MCFLLTFTSALSNIFSNAPIKVFAQQDKTILQEQQQEKTPSAFDHTHVNWNLRFPIIHHAIMATEQPCTCSIMRAPNFTPQPAGIRYFY